MCGNSDRISDEILAKVPRRCLALSVFSVSLLIFDVGLHLQSLHSHLKNCNAMSLVDVNDQYLALLLSGDMIWGCISVYQFLDYYFLGHMK